MKDEAERLISYCAASYLFFMPLKVTISGSYNKHLDRILEARTRFLEMGAEVLRPQNKEVLAAKGDFVRLQGDTGSAQDIHDAQLNAIRHSDFIYVVNPGGYVGPSATFEAGYAAGQGIPVVAQEAPFEGAVALKARVGTPEEAFLLFAAALHK
jgi:nucleoside 2-deoxyribosyltransferase